MIYTAIRPVQHAVQHAVLHRLASQFGCRCPDCGQACGPASAAIPFADEEEAADHAMGLLGGLAGLGRAAGGLARGARAAGGLARGASGLARSARGIASAAGGIARRAPAAGRRAARALPASVGQRGTALPAATRRAMDTVLHSMGWSGFRQAGRARPATMQDIQGLARIGTRVLTRTTRSGRSRRVVQLTAAGRAALRPGGSHAHLAPLFARPRGQRIYEIARGGNPNAAAYVGKTGRPIGRRLLEHLLIDRSAVGRGLRSLDARGRAGLQVLQGEFRNVPADAGRRQHLGEVLLQEGLRPAWNDPRRHGFEE
jgi:hypothetical protein